MRSLKIVNKSVEMRLIPKENTSIDTTNLRDIAHAAFKAEQKPKYQRMNPLNYLTANFYIRSKPFQKAGIVAVIALLFFLPVQKTYATHASGSDLTYTWVSGNTFKVTVSFFRDCAGVAAPTSITLNAKSTSCNKNQSYTLAKVPGSGNEISFPCNSVSTKCTNSSSLYAGYQQYRYEANVTLPSKCSDWVLSYYVCCRNCAITTLNNPCNDNMYVEATLNNLLAPTNSSPQFTNIPVAFLCINQSFTYNHGVVDPNGDSLVYSFITPKTYNTSNNTVGAVTFNAGYSASNPLTSTPAVNLNPTTGDINMVPTSNNEIGVAAILIREYRNGVLIGSVIRDMQFLTTTCSLNFLPAASGINGTGVFSAVACPGVPLSFTINSSDANAADTVKMTWNNVIPGGTFTTVGAKIPVGTFSWTPTTAQARPQPYTFTVTVRDNACPSNGSQTFSYSIVVPLVSATITSPTVNTYNVACFNGATGSATAVPSGGTPPYTYLWSPSGQTNATATGLTAITYTVTVSDANSCPAPASITLTAPSDSVSVSIDTSNNVSCNGGSDGMAGTSISGGISPYTYLWSPGSQTTAIASGLAANTYSVVATDNNGCTSQRSVVLTEPTPLLGSVGSFSNVTCNGNANGIINMNVSGGTPPYSHSWSNGRSTGTVTNLGPGTFTDTIRDAKGCMVIVSQPISEPGGAVGIPASSLSSTDVNCFGGSDGTANIIPSGGTPPYDVAWSNSDIGNSADSLAAGIYTVTIIDGNGCTFDTAITITEPAVLNSQFVNFSTTPAGTTISCNGLSDGEVRVSVFGGTPPYSYLWSDASTLDSITSKPAGTYWVEITDGNGCVHNDTTVFTEPTAFSSTLTKQDVICKGESSGWIKANPVGGSPLYSYLWSPLSQTTDSIGSLPTGFYDVTITDLNGCQVYDSVTVFEPDTLVPLITSIQFFGDVNVRCYGDSTAVVSVQVTGGTSPYTYQWSNGSTADTLYNLPAGTVSVFVRDFNGCSISGNRPLTQPGPFQYAPVISHPKCYGDSSGYIALNAAGSTGPYTYAWSTGAIADSTGNLKSGVTHVIVEDLNNCKDSVGFILSDPDSMSTPVSTSDYLGYNVSCIGSSDGYIALHVSGGTGGYLYSWSNSSTSDSISSLLAASYTVTITDSNGCMKDTTILISEPTALNLTLLADTFSGGFNVSCIGYNDGNAHSTVSGGVSPYHYAWSNGDVSDSAIGLAAGTHYLTVTDTNGCMVADTIILTEPMSFSLTATLSDFNGYNVPCFGDSAGCVSVVIAGGASPFTYSWDIQDTVDMPMICNLPADTIGLRVTDDNGCVLDSTFILTAPQAIGLNGILSQYSGFNVQCFGFNNGSVNLVVSGGVAPFNYLWSTGDTIEDINNLSALTYQVQVTDTNGCVDTASYTLSEPPQIQNSITSQSTSCGLNNGTAWVQVTAGLSPYSYFWTPSALSTDTVMGLTPGWHNVVITDSVGCMHEDSVEVIALPVMMGSITSQVDNLCFGRSTGSATVSVSGGTSPFTYLWTNGDTTATADSLAAGSFSVTVTDSSGCTEVVTVTITENNQIVANLSSSNATCSYLNNGSAGIVVTGGTAPLNVSWSNGDTGFLTDSLGMGYAVYTVVDSNSCTLIDSVNILQPAPLSATLTTLSNVSCFGDATATASVNLPAGGTAPYSYSWSNGDTGPFADSLVAGTINLVITDSNSCVLNLTGTVTQPTSALSANLSFTDATCFGDADGSAAINISGGTPAYSYLWTPGAATTSSITGLAQGNYNVTVTDSRNCTYTGSVTIIQPAQIMADAGQNITGCEKQYDLNAVLSSGYTGTWSLSSGFGTISNLTSPSTTVTQLAEGNNVFVWTISDGTCSGADSVVVHLHEAGECELELPSAFSPNGDGYNDGFFIRGIDRFPENVLTVFNRWGNEVFHKENYQNTQWFGQNKNGDDLPEGTYFVVLIIPGLDTKLSTYVDLRRYNVK